MSIRSIAVAMGVALMAGVAVRAADDPQQGLVIVDAIWKGHLQQANVTSKVRERVHGDMVEFPVTTEILGDPEHGTRKILRVTYRFHGVEHTLEFGERRTLKIPPDTDVPDTKTYSGDMRAQVQRISDATRALNTRPQGLEIVQAVFGLNGFWRDVTPIVHQLVSEDKLNAEYHLPFTELGGDPVKGRVKHLIIGYRVNGEPNTRVFDELNGNTIHVFLP